MWALEIDDSLIETYGISISTLIYANTVAKFCYESNLDPFLMFDFFRSFMFLFHMNYSYLIVLFVVERIDLFGSFFLNFTLGWYLLLLSIDLI